MRPEIQGKLTVGVATAPDGSLLVSDDGSNSIWQVDYVGAN
jgi:glucose/arabinose dehydrogenase